MHSENERNNFLLIIFNKQRAGGGAEALSSRPYTCLTHSGSAINHDVTAPNSLFKSD